MITLKSMRNLYTAATVLIVGIVLAGAVADRPGLKAVASRHLGDDFVGICKTLVLVAGVAGVIFLALSLLRLVWAVTSITDTLERHDICEPDADNVKSEVFPAGSFYSNAGFLWAGPLTKRLSRAISACIESYRDMALKMRQQLENLRVQLQLAGRQKRNTEAIIYSIRDAVLVVDEFDRVLMANETAGRIFNFDCKQAQFKPLRALVQPDKKEFVDFIKQCRNSKNRASRRQFEFVEQTRTRTFDCVVSCVYNHKQQVCGAVAVLHDITREKEISQMKNDFVSHVSHELKTPLASITAYSEMLCEGEANDEQTRKEFYQIIQSQAKRLNRMIEDILNISRIESGLIKVDKQPASLALLIEQQLQMIKSYAADKKIQVIRRNPVVFDQVSVDKDMISQVIINLLSNAIKYTPAGGTVSIDTEVDDVAGVVRVSITDTGVGIPEDEIDHVFDKFYRVKANENRAKGTGLGLNLVKQIVEKVHNGRLFVKSKPGQGSTFGFELPLARAEAVRTG